MAAWASLLPLDRDPSAQLDLLLEQVHVLEQHLKRLTLVPDFHLDHVVGLAIRAVHVALDDLDTANRSSKSVRPLVDRQQLPLLIEQLAHVAVGQASGLTERPVWVDQIGQALGRLALHLGRPTSMTVADNAATNRGLLARSCPRLGRAAAWLMGCCAHG